MAYFNGYNGIYYIFVIMKELSIEEKAKAYDEAIAKFNVILNLNTVKESGTIFADDVRKIFSELAESEDERIRKALISFLKSPFVNESITDEKVTPWIAWLEKQGEHAKFRDSIQVGDKVTRNQDGVLVNLSQLNRVAKKDEKQGEQKSNFKVGDIIKRPKSMVTYKVTNIDDYGFQLDGGHWFKLDRKSEFNLVEQKPWSEEDVGKAALTIRYLDIAKNYQTSIGSDYIDGCIDWLKSLKDRVQPQPKQEWSEKDEKLSKRVETAIDAYYAPFSRDAKEV